MAFTKTGSELEKLAIAGALTGAIRAGNLTDEERQALIEEYGLSDNASLGWRNAGRGLLGITAGSIPGRMVGHLGSAAGNAPMAIAGGLGAIGGAIYGAKRSTDKYSRGRAQDIMADRAQV